MKTKLTRREKVLITLMTVIAITFLFGKFLLLPAYQRYFDTDQSVVELRAKKMVSDFAVSNIEKTREMLQTAQETYDNARDTFPVIENNEQLDRLITGLCLEYNIKPTMLGMDVISKPVEKEEKPAQEDEGAEEESSEAQEIPEEEKPSPFTMATATVNASGNYQDLCQLVSAVADTDYIRISNLTYREPKEGASVSAASTITITFIVTTTIAKEYDALD